MDPKSPRRLLHDSSRPSTLRSPLLGLRHAMCSPAPRERENSDDSIDSPRISLDKDKSSNVFPSIKVEKCDALPPVNHWSTSESGRKTPSTPGTPESNTNLYVPSPVHKGRSVDGRVVMVTGNLESMKLFSKSEGDISAKRSSSPNNIKPKRLSANFTPEKSRPTVHLVSGNLKSGTPALKQSRSVSPNRSRTLHLEPLRGASRAKSNNDLSTK